MLASPIEIISNLEDGARPCHKPWNAGNTEGRITQPLRHNGVPYRGVNVLLLWGEAVARGYRATTWMTFRQARELKAFVRRGEHGSLVVYADRVIKIMTDENGDDVEREIPFLKGYTVFNVARIDGLPAHYYPANEPPSDTLVLIERAEAFFAATGATFRHGGNRAYHVPSRD